MNQNAIGEFIQIARKEKGLTQKQLADQIHVSDKTISKWENGFSTPDTSLLLSLCSALDISVNELISGKRISPDEYSKSAEENLVNLLQENKDNKRVSIIQYLLGILLSIVAIILNLGILQSRLYWYIDLPAVIFPACICMAAVLLSGKRQGKDKVIIARKTIIPAGLMVFTSGLVSALGDISEPTRLGPGIAICVLTIFYTAIGYIALIIIEEHMN